MGTPIVVDDHMGPGGRRRGQNNQAEFGGVYNGKWWAQVGWVGAGGKSRGSESCREWRRRMQKCECFHPPIGVDPTWMRLQIDGETSELYVWEKVGAVAQSWVITRRMRPPGMHLRAQAAAEPDR